MPHVAGDPPEDLGLFDISPTEMMFWMYLPISIPEDGKGPEQGKGYHYLLPPNLKQFAPIIHACAFDAGPAFRDRYVYLTAKTLWIEGGYIGNRPGWHIDGYGTDDLNYIWSDRAPTEFLINQRGWSLSEDCDESLEQMEKIAQQVLDYNPDGAVTYSNKHLLRLDNTVIHRSPVGFEAGMRTFVKVSLSRDQYNLLGNSINHDLPSTHWPLVDRRMVRNHPTYRNSDSYKAT